ncbi:MAG: TetR family transcriptional regulator C-terminal domain-containing protein [Gemmatimonadaceae bacterium]|nr:TetR family transcriptional regulator C-terminal domain-containing protein [Gemmatimonadaceae bacterium]
MSRPRTVSDAEILAAAAAGIAAVGPAHLRLAVVAEAAGLSAATLVQRFGSKRALLLHLAGRAVAQARAAAGEARAAAPSPLAAVRQVRFTLADMATTPQEMAHHLAFLQMDLTDPDFHRLARAHAREQERQLRALLVEAVEAGELPPGDTAVRARVLLAVTSGSLLRWAIVRKGGASHWLATDVDAVLASWRPDRGAVPM